MGTLNFIFNIIKYKILYSSYSTRVLFFLIIYIIRVIRLFSYLVTVHVKNVIVVAVYLLFKMLKCFCYDKNECIVTILRQKCSKMFQKCFKNVQKCSKMSKTYYGSKMFPPIHQSSSRFVIEKVFS